MSHRPAPPHASAAATQGSPTASRDDTHTVRAPRALADVPWWQRTTVYQVYPRSFADSNGDGIGDLRGLIGRLGHLHALGVETLWVSPFFDSPQLDFGYDIRDHFAVAPEYGTADDCRALIDAVHARGMRIVFDMVLNHTSDQHPWFLASRASRDAPERDFYLWRDGRKPHGRAPPNNWRSMLGPRGWHYDAATEQWYWASFLPFQPDLNYRNPVVKRAMLDVVRHWLREGVDGLRLDVFGALFKDPSFADNPLSLKPVPTGHAAEGFFQRPVHTVDHPDTLAFARELRAVVDAFTDPPRFLVGEVFGSPRAVRRYCGDAADGLHLVFLFKTLQTPLAASGVRALLAEFEREFPAPLCPTWVYGNHDRPRHSLRLRNHGGKARLLAMLQLTARGVPFLYYGEEIGMAHPDLPAEHGLDPVAARFRFVPGWLARWLRRSGILLNRDEARQPMAWDHGPHAGFTHPDARPWLPLHADGARTNVAAQESDPASMLWCYRHLLALRRASPALHAGSLHLHSRRDVPASVVAFRRAWDGAPAPDVADVFLNFGGHDVTVRVPGAEGCALFSTATGHGVQRGGDRVLRPWEGVVLLGGAPSVAGNVARSARIDGG